MNDPLSTLRGFMTLWRSVRSAACASCLVMVSGLGADAETRPAKAPQPKAATVPLVAPDPLKPARQAQSVGLGRCAPVLEAMGRQTLTRPYDLQSGWSRSDPAHHVFQSVAALTSPRNVPPDGLTALVAAPVDGGGCDGVALQVFPLAGDCEAAEHMMLKTGRLVAAMMNTRILLDGQGNRVILLPGYARTCIAVSVDSHFGAR